METMRIRQIIDFTIMQMRQVGSCGIRMDDIAKGLNMSKRTIYMEFPSKEYLARRCLENLARRGRGILYNGLHLNTLKIPVLDVYITVFAYVAAINKASRILLVEIRSKCLYKELAEQEKIFWMTHLTHALEKSKGCFALSISIPVEQLSYDILSFFYSNCVNGNSYVSQFQIVALLLRGLFKNIEVENVEYEISRINEYFLMKLEKPAFDRYKADSCNI